MSSSSIRKNYTSYNEETQKLHFGGCNYEMLD